MIDQQHDDPYREGLAADQQRRGLPRSSSERGWHFPPEKSPALEIVSAGIRMGPGLLLFAAVVAACAVVWCVS